MSSASSVGMEKCKPVMGHREQLKGGDEYDVLTQARKYYGFKPGSVKLVKRKFNKRVRREAKQKLADNFHPSEVLGINTHSR